MTFPKIWKIKLKDELLSNIGWASRFVWQSGPGLTIANVILVIVQGVLPLVGLYLIKLVIDAVSAGLVEPNRIAAAKEVTFLIILSGCVLLLENILGTVAGLVSARQAHFVTDRMYDILHAKSIEMDLEYYENSDYYDTLHRAQQEAPYRPTRIVNGLLQLGQSAISLIAITALLVSFHWSVPIFLIVAAIPGLLVRFRFAEKTFKWQRKRTPSERQAWYLNSLLTHDSHAKEIRLFNLGSLFADRFRQLRTQLRRENLSLATRRSIAELIAQSGAIIAAFAFYGFLAFRALQGLISLGDLVMFYQAIQRGQSYLRQFFGGIANLYENNLFLTYVHEFLSLKAKIVEPIRARPIRKPLAKGIVFDRLSFQYPNSGRKILEEITLTIHPGEHVALVGENGAGKTTLVKLLSRLYDPTEGAITFDGVNLRDLSLIDLRREIGIIFQDYAKYQLTAKENIWLGNIDLPPEEEGIIRAARQAGADDIISGLPNGYDTVLGKVFENGVELSIGEWQKIALARAFLRQAQIIVLDEPTSAMDAKAEYELFNKFHQLAKGRIAILISHRLSTVRMVDRIYVLEGGKITESGTHNELIHQGGKYAYLFERQAQHYR